MDKKTLFLIAILTLPMLTVFTAPATPAMAAPTISVWPGTGVAVSGVYNAFFVSGGGFDGGVKLWYYVEDWSAAYDQLMLGSPQDYNLTTEVYAKSTSSGAVPDFSYMIVWGDDLPATTTTLIGLAQSDTNPNPGDRAYRNVNLVHDISDVPYLTMDIAEGSTVHVGDTITVKGENFTPGGKVEIYWNNPDNLIATTTADDDGKIEVDVTVPETPSGNMALLVYDVEGDILALDHESSPEPHTWFGLYVEASLELDGTSIRGEAEETFNLIGHGFAWLNDAYAGDPDHPTDTAYLAGQVDEDTVVVDVVSTYHNAATANANGYIKITHVELSDNIDVTGWVDVYVDWYTDTYSDTAYGSILVSKPSECAEASFDTSGTTSSDGYVGDSFTVYVWNFAPNSNVVVKFGGVEFETTIHTDANGAGSASFTVPELPGDVYVIDAFYNGEHATLDFEILPTVSIDVSGEYVQSGWWVHVTATGLDPDLTYYPTEDGVDILPNTSYNMIAGSVVSEADDEVAPNDFGTLEFTYQAFYDNETVYTGDPIDVEIDGLTDTYYAVAVPYLSIESSDMPDWTEIYSDFITIDAGKKPTYDIYDPDDALVPTWDYQVLVDGHAIKVRPVGGNVFTGDDISDTQAISFRWNVTSTGMHKIEVAKKSDGLVVWSIDVLVSDVDGPEHMYLDTTTVTYDSTITAYFWNFEANEDLDILLDCTGQVHSLSVDEFGAYKEELTSFDFSVLPMGEYMVVPDGYPDLGTVITVEPSPTPTSFTDLCIGDLFDIEWYNLEPNTRYNLLFDNEVVATETSDDTGYLYFTDVSVPARVPGTYDLTLQKVLDGSIVQNYEDTVPTVEIANPFNLPEEAFPIQLVNFEWVIPASGLDDLKITVNINGTDWYTFTASTNPGINVGYDTIKGAFPMPNGGANDLLVVKLYAYDPTTEDLYEESCPVAMYRVSGAGALLVGADIASDLAYIKTTLGDVKTSLSELNATVTSIKDGVATLNTSFGTMQASLDAIDAKVTSIQGDVAEVKTTLGDVKASVSDVADAVAGAKSDVLSAISNVASSVSSLSSDVSSIASSVSSLSGDVSSLSSAINSVKSSADSISSAVSSLSSDVSSIKATVGDIKADTAGLGNISTFVIVAAILAAITVVLEIVVLARKK